MPGGATGAGPSPTSGGPLSPRSRHRIFFNLRSDRFEVLLLRSIRQLVGPEAIPDLRDDATPAAQPAQMKVGGRMGEVAIRGLEPRLE